MIKNKKHIIIVRSSTKGLSSLSEVSCNAIFEVLSNNFTRVEVNLVNNASDLNKIVANHPDLVFLGMEFVPTDTSLGIADPNKIWLSDVFDDMGIAYTGSSKNAHELGRNKPMAKQRILDMKLNTSAFYVIGQNNIGDMKDLPMNFPLFVKPANRGGGLGIDSYSVVHNFEELHSKVCSINIKLNSEALIEEYLPGREFSVAILKEEVSREYIVMPIELIAPQDKFGSRILSGQIKSANAEQAIAVSDPITKTAIVRLALNVFNALGARDYGRIDIRLDVNGIPQFLEANLIPSLISGYGSFPKACLLNFGLDYESMILQIVNLGLRHNDSDYDGNILESMNTFEVFNSKEMTL